MVGTQIWHNRKTTEKPTTSNIYHNSTVELQTTYEMKFKEKKNTTIISATQ